MNNRIKAYLILLISILLIIFQIIYRSNIKIDSENNILVSPTITPIQKIIPTINQNNEINNTPIIINDKYIEIIDEGWTEDINFEDDGNYIPN